MLTPSTFAFWLYAHSNAVIPGNMLEIISKNSFQYCYHSTLNVFRWFKIKHFQGYFILWTWKIIQGQFRWVQWIFQHCWRCCVEKKVVMMQNPFSAKHFIFRFLNVSGRHYMAKFRELSQHSFRDKPGRTSVKIASNLT